MVIDLTRERRVIASFEEANKCTPGILVTRLASLLHNRHSQQLGQLSTPPRASRPIFFRLLTVTPSFLLSPSCSSSPRLSLFFSRDFPSTSPWYLDMSLSTTCSVRHSPTGSFSISLPPFLSLSVPIPFVPLPSSQSHRPLSISINIDPLPLSFYLLIIFFYLPSSLLFTLLIFTLSSALCKFLSIALSPFLLLTLTFLLLFSFIPVLHCLNFIYFFHTHIWFNKVGGHVLPVPSHARVGHVVCTLYDDT